MRVIPENVTTRKKAEFTLVDIPKDAKVSGEHITGSEVSENGELKVTVSSTTLPGDYKFTLTSNGKEKDVTLHVLNATMAGEFKVEKLYETSDMNQINEEVRKSLQVEEVGYGDITEPVGSLDEGPAEYIMNINKLAETTVEGKTAKYFVVKVRLDEDYTFYNGDELVAVNKETGEKYITQRSKTETNSYFVYLDAEELSRTITMANKNSTEAQIKSKYYVDDVTITVDSTDAILTTVKNENGKPEISKVISSSVSQLTNNQNSSDIKAKVSLDENKFNTIDVYVKSDLLQKYSLGEGYEKYGSHNWIGIDFQIITGAGNSTDVAEVTVTSDNGAVAGVVDSEKLTINKFPKKKIAAWLPADFGANDSYVKTYTVHVKFDSEDLEEYEETDVTINVHNAGYVYLKSVEAGNEATAKVLESAVVCPTPHIGAKNIRGYMQDIKINVKKNGIVPTKYNPITGKYDKTEHLWAYLKLSYNVPYDWVVWNGAIDVDENKGPASGTQHASTNSHDSVNTDGIHDDYSEFVWFDLNAQGWEEGLTTETYNNAIYVTERAICNKYGLKQTENYTYDMSTNVRLIFDDYSDTATMFNHLEHANWALKNINMSKIKGVDIEGIEKPEVQAEVKKAINTSYNDGDSVTLDKLLEGVLNKEDFQDKNLGILSGTYGNLTINGTKGRWMLAYLSVRNPEAVTTNDNETFILDWADSAAIGGNLYRQGETGSADTAEIVYGRFALVPVWINLDSKELLKSNLTVSNVENEYGFTTLTLKSDYDKDGNAEEKNEMNVIIKVEKESN